MKIVEGLQQAKAVLLAQSGSDTGQVSPKVKGKLRNVFGGDISPKEAVARIVADVRKRGDAAVCEFTLKIDGVSRTSLEVGKEERVSAVRQVDKGLISALTLAEGRIRAFHKAQKDNICRTLTGKEWGQLVRPLERVGVYAPGGTASYPSTVLMTAVPAKVAGVKEVILATPPGANGFVPAATLTAAEMAGVDRVFSIGGAQAIAALAFGTESVPKVDKICGPGNIFVVLAKKLVYGTVDIDGLQGPSEVLIIADGSAKADYCAADLLAQAEHDTLAQAILVTTSKQFAGKVNEEIVRQLEDLPRAAIARESLENGGLIAVVSSTDEAVELANIYAPEHLQLVMSNARDYLDRIKNAGCIFIGEDSPVAIGDYVAGPNHVLPTGSTARFSSPLNIMDFVKFIDIVDINKNSLKKIAHAAITIARAEGLEAHARAVERRIR